jgi:hypothetical protein
MIPRLAIAIVFTALSPMVINAQGRNVYSPFDSKDNYQAKLHVLGVFVQHYGRSYVNRIYIANADSGDGSMSLYGYWPEGNSILLLDHFNPTFDGRRETTDYAWLDYKTRIDLRRDVVPAIEDIGGSSHLVDRAWTQRIMNACVNRGRKIIIQRRAHR